MSAFGSPPSSVAIFAPGLSAPFPFGEDLVLCVGGFMRRLPA